MNISATRGPGDFDPPEDPPRLTQEQAERAVASMPDGVIAEYINVYVGKYGRFDDRFHPWFVDQVRSDYAGTQTEDV